MGLMDKVRQEQIAAVNESLKTIREISGGKGIDDVKTEVKLSVIVEDVEVISNKTNIKPSPTNSTFKRIDPLFFTEPKNESEKNKKDTDKSSNPPKATPCKNEAGVDRPMYVFISKDNLHAFAWNGVALTLPNVETTKILVEEIKLYNFESFKRMAEITNLVNPDAKNDEPIVETKVESTLVKKETFDLDGPVMAVQKDGSYVFAWNDFYICQAKEDVDLAYIQEVMSSSYEVFALNSKMVDDKHVEEDQVAKDELKTALKEATASMAQEQPTSVGEALKKAALEDRQYDAAEKPFKFKTVRGKRGR